MSVRLKVNKEQKNFKKLQQIILKQFAAWFITSGISSVSDFFGSLFRYQCELVSRTTNGLPNHHGFI